MLQKTFKSFTFAFNGLRTTWREEMNFRIEILAGGLVLFLCFYFSFSILELILCVMCITIVLSAEIVNTAVEDLCNRIESNSDPIIGKVKDIMSAFVLVSSTGAFVIGFLVFYNHFI